MIEVPITSFDPSIEQKDSTIAKDIRLNFRRIIEEGSLSPEEAYCTVLATATAVEYPLLREFAKTRLADLGVNPEQIREAEESSAIMAMLNTYYRFRYMVGKHDEYQTAGLRMTSLARPALGKERFEMLAFAVSVINGCQSCVVSHEDALRKAGVSAGKVHDLARLSAVVKALKTLSTT
ncbi:MAG TPA: carboxymuconolactone decarboxylase family protein [Acidobacteriota bacterium]|nr:carboxymuconolactone decarboxylase family protein [Acidobacteriota bacterium]